MADEEITVGRIMHFVLGRDSRNPCSCRPAIVVQNWGGLNPLASLNMVVFTDGKNDGQYGTDAQNPTGSAVLTQWETSVMAAHEVKVKRSWHWPRECSGLVAAAETIIDGKLTDHPHAVGIVDPHNCWTCKEAAKETAPVEN